MTALAGSQIVDLSVPISERLPANWPTHTRFQHKTWNWYVAGEGDEVSSRLGAYTTRWMLIDEHTGTHMDAPCHFIPPPDSGLEHANEWGAVKADGIPLEQLVGPAAVIDAPDADAAPGHSVLITAAHIEAWEAEHGRLQPGDVVLFRSGWDSRYLPDEAGDAYAHDVFVTGRSPGWAAPDVGAVELLAERGVRCAGTDGPTMGPAEGGLDVHVAGLGVGMVFLECLANLEALPPRGATFMFLPIRILNATGAPGRAIALLP